MKRPTLLMTLATGVLMAYAATPTPVWQLTTDTGNRVPVADIEYLIAADSEPTFSVILKDNTSVDNVSTATFELSIPNSISSLPDAETTVRYAGSTITIMGATGKTAQIFAIDGSLSMQCALTYESTLINIDTLPPAVYILKIGGTAVRFIKK